MQPTSGFQYKRISGTTIGTTVIKANYLKNVIIGNNKVGTVTLYDDASGTSSAVLTSISNSSSVPASISFDTRLRNGLVAVAEGTTDLLITYN